MVERLYLLLEIVAILICAGNIFGKRFTLDILTCMYIFVNILAIQILTFLGVFHVYGYVLYLLLLLYCFIEYKTAMIEGIIRFILLLFVCICMQLLCSVPFLFVSTYLTGDEVYLYTNMLFLLVAILFSCKLPAASLIERMLHRRYRVEKIILLLVGVGIVTAMVVSFRYFGGFHIMNYILSLIVIIIVMGLVFRWMNLNYKVRQLERERQIAMMYDGTVQELVDTMRMRQHDFKNHLQALLSIAESKNDAEQIRMLQRAYCSDVIEMLRESAMVYSVNTPPLAAFMYIKIEEANRKNIRTEYQFSVEQCEVGIPIYEIVEIIGILLDNAYEAVEELSGEERIVKVQLIETEGCLYLKISNPTNLTLQQFLEISESGRSTKGEGRGIGLTKIAGYCKTYGLERTVDIEMRGNKRWLELGIDIKG